MLRLIIVIVALSVVPAIAQQGTPNEQALSAKLLQELQNVIQCNAATISTKLAMDQLQARVKELEDKYEKKEPPK